MPIITAREPVPMSAPVQPVAPKAQQQVEIPIVPEVTKPQEQLSPRFAQLAQKEKALRRAQQQIQQEKEAMKAKIADYETSYLPKSKLTELAKSNPLGALEQMGISADEFTQALINANPLDARLQKMMERIEAVENGNKQTLTNLEMQQEAAYKQALTQIRNDIKLTADSDKRFETVKEADAKGWEATEGAVALVEEVFNSGWPEKKIPKGTIISNEQALEHVQQWVMEKAYEMAQLKGVKEKFSPPPAPEVLAQKNVAQTQVRAPVKTLSNNMTPTTTRLSAKDRRDRAVALLEGRL
jgi:acyl transferase domain-containing protein